MIYSIEGLDPAPWLDWFELDDTDLALRGAMRVVARRGDTLPCRVSLEDAPAGQSLLLVNHESRPKGSPYHARHAIFVSESAGIPASFVDTVPPVVASRKTSLRAFDVRGLMIDAALAEPGEADAGLRRMFADPNVVEIDIHNAVRGCFSSRARRFA